MNLTPEQLAALQSRMAQADGFTVAYNEYKALYELLTPEGKWEHPYDADGDNEAHCWRYAPDYATDFNAVHRLEEKLTDEQHEQFCEHICELAGVIGPNEKRREVISACSLARCIALDRTLNPENPIV